MDLNKLVESMGLLPVGTKVTSEGTDHREIETIMGYGICKHFDKDAYSIIYITELPYHFSYKKEIENNKGSITYMSRTNVASIEDVKIAK